MLVIGVRDTGHLNIADTSLGLEHQGWIDPLDFHERLIPVLELALRLVLIHSSARFFLSLGGKLKWSSLVRPLAVGPVKQIYSDYLDEVVTSMEISTYIYAKE